MFRNDVIRRFGLINAQDVGLCYCQVSGFSLYYDKGKMYKEGLPLTMLTVLQPGGSKENIAIPSEHCADVLCVC